MAGSIPNVLKPGDSLGPYRIDSLIGKGGMGEVYRGTDTRLGRPVAIKVCAQEFNDRFEREAKAISSLNHPNICTLYVKLANTRMVQCGHGARFPFKALAELGFRNLDGDDAVQARVACFVDFTHAPGANRRKHFMRPKFIADGSWHVG